VSWRIRALLCVVAFRHIGTAYALHADEILSTSPTFRTLFVVLPSGSWQIVLGALGIACIGGVLWPREVGIRALVIASVGVSAVWATSFIAAGIIDQAAAALPAVVFTSLALKDLIVAGMSYSNPLEAIVTREDRER